MTTDSSPVVSQKRRGGEREGLWEGEKRRDDWQILFSRIK